MENPSEYFRINVMGTQRMLEIFRNTRFVYSSSSSIYGTVAKDRLPVREDYQARPISPYALSKFQAEQICMLYSELYGTKVCVLRYFTVYGPRQRPDEAFTKFIGLSFHGKPITIYGDGSMTRDFTYVTDVVDGTIRAGDAGAGIYNIGSGSNVTVNQMVSEIRGAFGGKVKTQYVPAPPGDVQDTFSDITKARIELGYSPRVSLGKGVKSCVEWYKTSEYASDVAS
jgi:UDP-glucose 4-epimerase